MDAGEQAVGPRINLHPFSQCVREVIRDIVPETVCVFRPDEEPLHEGVDLPSFEPRLEVNIGKWLPDSCQAIRRRNPWERMEASHLAEYATNGGRVLWPLKASQMPDGPGAFQSSVIVSEEFLSKAKRDSKGELCVKGVIAHELVHALHAMRYIVPAFLDWRTFWEVFLRRGAKCTPLHACWRRSGRDLDECRSDGELTELRRYWPSKAEAWVAALREWGSERQSGNSD